MGVPARTSPIKERTIVLLAARPEVTNQWFLGHLPFIIYST